MTNSIAQDITLDIPTGIVNNIQQYCTEDGPGIRTTVFLKGCTLTCDWCSNPESMHFKPELAYNPNTCIGARDCGLCIPACPESAIHVIDGEKAVSVDFSRCTNCSLCVAACPAESLRMYGDSMTLDQVITEVDKDGGFYSESGGGMTLSGGECLAQPDFAAQLLMAAHKRGYNTVIETAANVPYRNMQKVLPHADLVLHDIKFMDSECHLRFTGCKNDRILDNLKRAYSDYPDKYFVARTPIIPGINDNEEEVHAVLDFIRPYKNVIGYQLLPYHRFGQSRYTYMGFDFKLDDIPSAREEDLVDLRALVDAAFGRKDSSLATSYPPDMRL